MRHERRRFGRRRRSRGRWPLWLAIVLLGAFLLSGALRPEWFLQAELARQRWLAGADQKAIEVDGRSWQYLEAGAGPPLLLLHGFTGSKENWLPVIGALAENYRVIAPDLPGSGFGDAAAAPPFGYRADADRLAAFADRVIGAPAFDLVGHSMGGGVAAVFAGTRPQRLRHLVLISAAGVEFDNPFAQAVLHGEHPFAVGDRATLDRYLGLVFDDPPWVPWPVDRALIARRIANDAAERQLLAVLSGAEATVPALAATAIDVPTLLLWCRDDRVVDAVAAERYRELIADAELALLDGCNHMPMMERPDATAQALLDFLGRD